MNLQIDSVTSFASLEMQMTYMIHWKCSTNKEHQSEDNLWQWQWLECVGIHFGSCSLPFIHIQRKTPAKKPDETCSHWNYFSQNDWWYSYWCNIFLPAAHVHHTNRIMGDVMRCQHSGNTQGFKYNMSTPVTWDGSLASYFLLSLHLFIALIIFFTSVLWEGGVILFLIVKQQPYILTVVLHQNGNTVRVS